MLKQSKVFILFKGRVMILIKFRLSWGSFIVSLMTFKSLFTENLSQLAPFSLLCSPSLPGDSSLKTKNNKQKQLTNDLKRIMAAKEVSHTPGLKSTLFRHWGLLRLKATSQPLKSPVNVQNFILIQGIVLAGKTPINLTVEKPMRVLCNNRPSPSFLNETRPNKRKPAT